MREWIPIVMLYLLGLGIFRVLGGFGAAAGALRRWGHGSSSVRTSPGASSS